MVSLSEVAAGLQPTTKTYLTDSYKKTLLTTLLRFVPETKRSGYLITAETIMHPKGGAQPSDTGYIEGDGFKARVKKVLEQGGVVIHFAELLEGSATEGRTVRMTLDWGQRYLVMRLHTAGHIIDYAVLQLLGQDLLSSKAYQAPQRAISNISETQEDSTHPRSRGWLTKYPKVLGASTRLSSPEKS